MFSNPRRAHGTARVFVLLLLFCKSMLANQRQFDYISSYSYLHSILNPRQYDPNPFKAPAGLRATHAASGACYGATFQRRLSLLPKNQPFRTAKYGNV